MYTRCQSSCKLLQSQIAHWSRQSIYFNQIKSRNKLNNLLQQQRRRLHEKGAAAEEPAILRWSKFVWNRMFGKYLFATNVISSGVLMVVGDVMAQEYEYRRGIRTVDRFDGDRIGRMFIAGALQGPLHHYVYIWMDRVMPTRTLRTTVYKILIDQLFMSPACIMIFFYSLCYMEQQSLKEMNKEIFEKFPYIYLMDWLMWPAAQYINFRYLDTKYRVMFVNVCTAIYNVFMSYMKHDFGVHIPTEMIEHVNDKKQ